MNHKRKRPANRRAGCKMCKPWKINGAKKFADLGTSGLRKEFLLRHDERKGVR